MIKPAEHTGEEERPAKPYRVLSLDGGGTRGIYTAAFLDRLLTQSAARRSVAGGLDLGLGFDLITGTSTGAIVGCAAAIGLRMADVVGLYRNHGSAIFPHRITGLMSVLYRACTGDHYVRKGDHALREALDDILGDVTIADVFEKRGISLSIPAVRMSTHKAYVFKRTAKSGVRDDHFRLADVCLASSAAPIYRSLAAIDTPGTSAPNIEVFADGGLWANNPIMVGLTDALANAAPAQPIEIFSLGTCPRPEGEHVPRNKVHRSMLGWRFGADVSPLSIAAQEFAYDNMARLIAGAMSECGHRSVKRVRFPNKDVPASMMPYLALDDSRASAMDRLVGQAHVDADMTLSACDDAANPDGRLICSLLESLPQFDSGKSLVRGQPNAGTHP
jgi:predicted acylesterase/phospholipase RssA